MSPPGGRGMSTRVSHLSPYRKRQQNRPSEEHMAAGRLPGPGPLLTVRSLVRAGGQLQHCCVVSGGQTGPGRWAPRVRGA